MERNIARELISFPSPDTAKSRLSRARGVMKESRFTESQILAMLKKGEAGVPVAERARKYGIRKETSFNWRALCRSVAGRAPAPAGA